jgi:hypothetical protein
MRCTSLRIYLRILYGTLLNIPGKIKDGIKVRQDMVEMGMRPELAPVEEDGK